MLRSKILALHLPLGLVAACAASAVAQTPGDYLLTDSNANRLFAGRPSTGLTRIFTPRVDHNVGDVMMGRNNRNILVVENGASSTVASGLSLWSPTTVLVNFGLGIRPQGLAIDGYGRYLAGHALIGSGAITATSNGVTNTLVTTPRPLMGLAEDMDTGGYVAVDDTDRLVRISRSGVASVITALGSPVMDVEHDTRTGDFVVACANAPHIRRIDRNSGAVVDSFNFPVIPQSLDMHSSVRRLDICGGQFYGSFQLDGTPFSAIGNVPGSQFDAIARFGERRVAGRGTGQQGSMFHLDLSFPRCANRPYVTLLSLALRPSIPVGPTQEVCLQADTLFVNALSGVFDNLILFNRLGTLSASGEATTRIAILPSLPVGLRFFASAVAICPTAPTGIQVAESIGITIR